MRCKAERVGVWVCGCAGGKVEVGRWRAKRDWMVSHECVRVHRPRIVEGVLVVTVRTVQHHMVDPGGDGNDQIFFFSSSPMSSCAHK
jgi:hypothetical protein